MQYLFPICPVDTGCKFNAHKTSRASSERLMYVQFTSCVYWVVITCTGPIYSNVLIKNLPLYDQCIVEFESFTGYQEPPSHLLDFYEHMVHEGYFSVFVFNTINFFTYIVVPLGFFLCIKKSIGIH